MSAQLLVHSAAQLAAGLVFVYALVLVGYVLAGIHRAGVQRLLDAGEPLPWWLPHRDDRLELELAAELREEPRAWDDLPAGS